MNKWIYIMILFLGITGCSKEMTSSQNVSSTQETTIMDTPAFYVYDGDGNKISLQNINNSVIINFWASWCPGCQEEMDSFQKAFENNKDISFMMVNVTDGDMETKESVLHYMEEKKYTFPIYFDQDGSAVRAFEIDAIPVTVCIDKSGDIHAIYYGGISDEKLQNEIKNLK